MARDIKAIQCPKCGSVSKKEVKPDFYRCENCGTEYFLDSDDVHIYHHQTNSQRFDQGSPGNPKLPVYVLLGVVGFSILVYLIAMLFQPKKLVNTTSIDAYKAPRSSVGHVVYTNTITGNPVYLRLGTEYIYTGNTKTGKKLHEQYNDVMTGKLIADKVIPNGEAPPEDCYPSFKTYSPDMIYCIACNSALYQLDAANNQFINITKSLFKNFPQLSSGIAKIDDDYDKPIINLMTNDGVSYHYFPTIRKLVASDEQADQLWKTQFNRHYFRFGIVGSDFDDDHVNHLIEVTYRKETGKLQERELNPGRKFFAPKIIYQDDQNLLITVNTTASEKSPITIQRIDVATGNILWALPPNNDNIYSIAKCKQGFAIEYQKGEEADYVHGVYVISPAGKLIHNYQLSRIE